MAGKSIALYLAHLFRVILALVFLYAGAIKVYDPGTFLSDINNYKLTMHELSFVISLFLPWLEILSALSLFLRKYREAAAMIITLMMIVFLVAIVSAWARDLDITCGCFGGGDKVSYAELIIRDLLLLGMAIYLYVFDRKAKSSS